MADESEEEGIVPSGAFDFAFDGPLVGVLAEEVEGELSQESEVLRGVVGAASHAVLVEGDIEDPVQLVFDGPGDCQEFRA